MEQLHREKLIVGSPLLSCKLMEIILKQMKKNICKIKNGNQRGSGFFCKIPFPSKESMLPVLITNNHIIDKSLFNTKIKLSISGENKEIDLGLGKRKKRAFEDFDITIIEILKEDSLDRYLEFFELDDLVVNNIINKNNNNKDFDDKEIYIIQFPKGELSVSFGIMPNIDNDKHYFFHTCSTEEGSSGSPIIGINNQKIIGIHCGKSENKKSNLGPFLNLAIKEFIEVKDEMSLIKFNLRNKTKINDIKV